MCRPSKDRDGGLALCDSSDSALALCGCAQAIEGFLRGFASPPPSTLLRRPSVVKQHDCFGQPVLLEGFCRKQSAVLKVWRTR